MFGALKKLASRKPQSGAATGNAAESKTGLPGLSRNRNGKLGPSLDGQNEGDMADGNVSSRASGAPPNAGPQTAAQAGNGAPGASGNSSNGSSPSGGSPTGNAPSTSALNKQVVQSAAYSNYENAVYAPTMVATPPEMMVGQTTGLAVQDAANYMNAIMQIAVAAQAVAIKKAAEDPALAAKEIPLLTDIQQMVTQAVTVYGSVSSTAGTSAKTVISDLKSG